MAAMDYAKVAQFYDAYAKSTLDVDFFIEEGKRCRHVLELTSGTGRLSLPLIEAGVPLSCLDNSPEMLQILRKKMTNRCLSAQIYEMDASNFSIPEKFDLILFPFNSFSELVELGAQQNALSAVSSHLTDTGRAIYGDYNRAVFDADSSPFMIFVLARK